MNLPLAFEEKMSRLLGDEFEEYIRCYEEPRYYGLRVNTAKISPEEFLVISPFKLTPIPWIKNGFYYDGEQVSPAKHPYYFAGLYYLQEPSAMTPASRLPISENDRVLDVCAAPGGKATELGARLKGTGLLAANDISSSRAKGLLKNLEVFGISNMLVLSEEPGDLIPYFREYFDKILIDAPCSGEGMFRKDKKMIKAWEEHGPSFFAKLQRSIITQAAQMLRPGGMILYSTCTFDPEENEGTIQYLLDEYPEFEVLPIEGYEGFAPGIPESIPGGSKELCHTVRIFPHRMKGEGHFLALLKKKDEGTHFSPENPTQISRKGVGPKPKKVPDELAEFWKNVSWELNASRLDIHGERVYYMPEGLPELKGIRFLRTGLLLGELKKKRFEPSQAFAMALKKEEYACTLDLRADDERLARYLKGETIEVSDLAGDIAAGWHLVCVDGYPLGWGKLSGGTLKNKYLPGWRNQSA
ncbi:RsmF rRNA methyltransferase first C-terminal domain-containing protein [Roseburia hominis]